MINKLCVSVWVYVNLYCIFYVILLSMWFSHTFYVQHIDFTCMKCFFRLIQFVFTAEGDKLGTEWYFFVLNVQWNARLEVESIPPCPRQRSIPWVRPHPLICVPVEKVEWGDMMIGANTLKSFERSTWRTKTPNECWMWQMLPHNHLTSAPMNVYMALWHQKAEYYKHLKLFAGFQTWPKNVT